MSKLFYCDPCPGSVVIRASQLRLELNRAREMALREDDGIQAEALRQTVAILEALEDAHMPLSLANALAAAIGPQTRT